MIYVIIQSVKYPGHANWNELMKRLKYNGMKIKHISMLTLRKIGNNEMESEYIPLKNILSISLQLKSMR